MRVRKVGHNGCSAKELYRLLVQRRSGVFVSEKRPTVREQSKSPRGATRSRTQVQPSKRRFGEDTIARALACFDDCGQDIISLRGKIVLVDTASGGERGGIIASTDL